MRNLERLSPLQRALLLTVLLCLQACGSGGGDSSTPRVNGGPADGNHSAPAGAFLAALILYATITTLSPLDLPPLPQLGIDADTQAVLRAIAAETLQTVPPRQWC